MSCGRRPWGLREACPNLERRRVAQVPKLSRLTRKLRRLALVGPAGGRGILSGAMSQGGPSRSCAPTIRERLAVRRRPGGPVPVNRRSSPATRDRGPGRLLGVELAVRFQRALDIWFGRPTIDVQNAPARLPERAATAYSVTRSRRAMSRGNGWPGAVSPQRRRPSRYSCPAPHYRPSNAASHRSMRDGEPPDRMAFDEGVCPLWLFVRSRLRGSVRWLLGHQRGSAGHVGNCLSRPRALETPQSGADDVCAAG
jgi:hypothetical protein